MDPEDRALDAALGRWAIEPAGDEAAVERIIRHGLGLADPAPRRRWQLAAAGTALAASVAMVMILSWPRPEPMAAEKDDAEAVASFMLLHTPSPYEEPLL
jgi:hypothetical protein